MKKMLYILLPLTIFSCNSNKEKSLNKNIVEVDTLKSNTKIPAWVISLWEKHFSKNDINTLTDLYNEWLNIKTENELAKFYFTSIEKSKAIASNVQNELDKLSENEYYRMLDAFIKDNDTTKPWLCGLDPGCFAECTVPGFRKNFALLFEKAKYTDGTNDEEYFKLMLNTYGESGYVSTLYSSYFTGMWDYGGGSLLGSGQHIMILKKIDAIQKQTKIFDAEIITIREDILRDIIEHMAYMNTADKIVIEIDDIIRTIKLNDTEKQKLEIRKAEFLNPDSKIQTDCENKNCDYGG